MGRLSNEEKIKRSEQNGLKFVSGDLSSHDSKFNVMCECGEIIENTTLRIIKNSGYYMRCKKCRAEYKRNLFKSSFDEVLRCFAENNCKLISNKEDYSNAYSKLTYIARCGHVYTTTFINFKNSKHHLCGTCAKKVNSGENAYNWNGGYDSENIKFRKTYEFKQWVKSVYKRDDYTCQSCYKKGVKLNAHHLNGYNWDIENRTNVDNGITLCEDCHNDFHNTYGRGNNTKEQFEEWVSNTYKIKL